MKLTKAEKIALKAFIDEFENSFCGTRAGKTEDDKDAYLCRECPFYMSDGSCKLREWRIKHDVSKRLQ